MSERVKQIIVFRTQFPDGRQLRQIRTGKLLAQAAHASMSFLTERALKGERPTEVEMRWLEGHHFPKIVCYVETEEELLTLKQTQGPARWQGTSPYVRH